jgi:hypothetical protein
MSFIPSAEQKHKDKTDPKKDSVPAKPLTQQEDFCAELVDGHMDFSGIEDKQFIVAVNTGSRNKPPLLASTMKGVFDFYEMVEAVGCMWEREQHHAMVYILTKSYDEATTFLDEGTVDWIEANWEDMVATGILEAAIADYDDDSLIIPAGVITADPEDDE